MGVTTPPGTGPLTANLHVLTSSGGFVNPAVLVAFNPQPDPPGDFGLGTVGFTFFADPMMTVRIFELLPGGNDTRGLSLIEVPEPAGLGIALLAGGLMAVRRRH